MCHIRGTADLAFCHHGRDCLVLALLLPNALPNANDPFGSLFFMQSQSAKDLCYLFNVLLQDQTCVGCNTHNSVPSQNRQKCASIDFNSSYHSIMYNLPTDIIDERFLKSVQKKNKEGHKKLSNNSSVAQQKF